jgi:hypothetical protein
MTDRASENDQPEPESDDDEGRTGEEQAAINREDESPA